MNTQEQTWQGDFGTDYTRRQKLTVESRAAMFNRAWNSVWPRPTTVLELGAGAGDNLRALREIGCTAHMTGIEVNPDAYHLLKEVTDEALLASAIDFRPTRTWDLVLTRGFLIHVHPRDLPQVYDSIHKAAGKYILIAEYFCPTPRMIPYRGIGDILWARDFTGELLDRHDDLALLDYGFVSKRDPVAPRTISTGG